MGEVGVVYQSEYPSFYFPRRYAVVILGWAAITIAYMVRSNLSIAILVMSKEYNWPLEYKGMFLSAFFWGYITTQLIGGMAARKFGPKAMTTFVIVVPSIFTLLIPLVAPHSEILFVVCRVLTGVAGGATFPTMFLMLSGWIPFHEKATTLAIVFAGTNIGTIIIDTVGPVIMSKLGWQYVFYISGGVGFIWLFFWVLIITDTPGEMRNIHPNEVKFINDTLIGQSEHSALLPKDNQSSINKLPDDIDGATPPGKLEKAAGSDLYSSSKALKILTRNTSFWNIVWAGFCTNWGSYIFLTWLPTYVHTELGFSVQWSGVIAITPSISGACVSFTSGKICDILLARGYDKLRVRKAFFTIGCAMYASTLVMLAIKDTLHIPNGYAAIILALGTGGSGFFLPGMTANIYDIAPYHPSLVVGISNTAGTIPGIVGVFLTGVLLQAGLGWGTIWFLTASFYFLALISCLFFADVKRLV